MTGDSIVTASEDRTLKILDAADGSCRSILAKHTNRVRCVCVMPDGRIVSGSRDGTLIVWARDGSHLRRWKDTRTTPVFVDELSKTASPPGQGWENTYLGRELPVKTVAGAASAVRCLSGSLPGGN